MAESRGKRLLQLSKGRFRPDSDSDSGSVSSSHPPTKKLSLNSKVNNFLRKGDDIQESEIFEEGFL